MQAHRVSTYCAYVCTYGMQVWMIVDDCGWLWMNVDDCG